MRMGWKECWLQCRLLRLRWRRFLALAGLQPLRLEAEITSPWQGNPVQGRALLGGEFRFHGDRFHSHEESWRKIDQMDLAWQRDLHGFSWLRDVVSYNDDPAEAERIRQFIGSWWQRQLHKHPVGRHPDILGQRVAEWLIHHRFLMAEASPRFRRRLNAQLYEGLIRLERTRIRKGARSSLTQLKGLIVGALTLPSAQFLLLPALSTLRKTIALRFHPDGGHVSRSPEWQLEELRILLEIRHFLEATHPGSTGWLDETLAPMMTALATVTHPDTTLALFNDSLALSTREVARLWQSWRKPQPVPLALLPDSRFVRLQQAASVLMMDVGTPAPALSRSAHGTLGFEFSSSEEKIITHCGGYRGTDHEWRRACKATAAHSTLSIDNANSWQPADQAHYTLVFTPEVSCDLESQEQQITVDAATNGYVPYAGVVHYRRLTLTEEGRCLQGVDVLTPHKSLVLRDTHRVQIRFHLMPEIAINRISRGSIELLTPKGHIWRFHSPRDMAAGVEDSVYLGKEGKPVRSVQLCIESLLSGQQDLRVDWELRKLG